MSDSSPLVSVIIPLPDHRGQTANSLNSFLGQTLDPEEYEIIVLSDGKDPELEAEIETRFPDIRFIRQSGANASELYNIGAAAAKGDYLFITEMHCIAKPDCLEKILNFISDTDYSAASCRSYGISRNWLAEGEQHIFDQDLKRIRKEDEGKATIRGFLIKRGAWEQLGGFQSEFGHFSEVMFGRRMRALGMKIGYADEAVVGHFNQVNMLKLLEELIPYGYAECQSTKVASEDGGGACPEWVEFENGRIGLAGLKLQAFIIRAKLLARYVVMRCLAFVDSDYYDLYLTNWHEAIRLGRLQYIDDVATRKLAKDNK